MQYDERHVVVNIVPRSQGRTWRALCLKTYMSARGPSADIAKFNLKRRMNKADRKSKQLKLF